MLGAGMPSPGSAISQAPQTNIHAVTTLPHSLFVWDFDWTIVNCNSDEYIPAQFIEDVGAGFRDLLEQGNDWHSCVEAMVRRAITEENATQETILDAARKMPYLTSVKQALTDISRLETTGQMILSDGNTLFLGAFLDSNGLREYFTHGVVSNEGSWDGNCHLQVVHQSQQYGGHDCHTCSANLCKTQALQKTLDTLKQSNNESDRQMQRRPRIVYVGDGANDACPVLNVLCEGDVLLARAGNRRKFANSREGPETDEEAITSEEGSKFGILPTLLRAKEGQSPVVPKCQVSEWNTGDELRHLVGRLLKDTSTTADE